jgi:hypothetical protein
MTLGLKVASVALDDACAVRRDIGHVLVGRGLRSTHDSAAIVVAHGLTCLRAGPGTRRTTWLSAQGARRRLEAPRTGLDEGSAHTLCPRSLAGGCCVHLRARFFARRRTRCSSRRWTHVLLSRTYTQVPAHSCVLLAPGPVPPSLRPGVANAIFRCPPAQPFGSSERTGAAGRAAHRAPGLPGDRVLGLRCIGGFVHADLRSGHCDGTWCRWFRSAGFVQALGRGRGPGQGVVWPWRQNRSVGSRRIGAVAGSDRGRPWARRGRGRLFGPGRRGGESLRPQVGGTRWSPVASPAPRTRV